MVLLAVVQTLAVVAVACGVPTGESTFERVEGGELAGLNDTTTTSTTTTTTTTTLPDIPDSTIQPPPSSSTEPTPQLVAVQIYFIARGVLQPVEVELPPPVSTNLLVAALESGPPEASIGLESFVEDGLIIGQPVNERGILTVDLAAEVYDDLTARNQFLAVAQMVLTFTSNLAGVGQITFLLDGEPTRVPTDGASLDVVTGEDYESLQTGPRSSAEPSGEPTTGTIVGGFAD